MPKIKSAIVRPPIASEPSRSGTSKPKSERLPALTAAAVATASSSRPSKAATTAAEPTGATRAKTQRLASSPMVAATTAPAPAMPGPAVPSTAITVAPVTGKQAQVVALLTRLEGASIAELMQSTGWLSHSVRGLLSAVVKRKLGLAVVSATEPERGRVYRIEPTGADPEPPPATAIAPDTVPATMAEAGEAPATRRAQKAHRASAGAGAAGKPSRRA